MREMFRKGVTTPFSYRVGTGSVVFIWRRRVQRGVISTVGSSFVLGEFLLLFLFYWGWVRLGAVWGQCYSKLLQRLGILPRRGRDILGVLSFCKGWGISHFLL